MVQLNNQITLDFFDRSDTRKMKIVLADHDRNAPGRDNVIVERRVRKARMHADFEARTYNNDIAILELDHPVEFDAKIQPACLPLDGKTETRISWLTRFLIINKISPLPLVCISTIHIHFFFCASQQNISTFSFLHLNKISPLLNLFISTIHLSFFFSSY